MTEAPPNPARNGIYAPLPLDVPDSPERIEEIQRRRKVVALDRARRSAFWAPRLGHIDRGKLDDPEEWARIPILDKEQLRALDDRAFYEEFCIAPLEEVCEYWRSGGSTGKPLFYPRTYEDIRWNMVGFARTFACAGIGAGERAHLSFPLGIHPAGHMWARAGQIMGVGVNWAGSGAALPSLQQLALIESLRPTIWMGMSSYGLYLANLADNAGIDLAAGPVRRILCTAEPVSAAKRRKLERMWGADMYDCFGMTEVSMMGAEGPARDGFHVWTDLAVVEVLDPETWKPVADGEPGRMVVTALCGNAATPFLRWDSGDIVIRAPAGAGAGAGPYSVFPVIRHAHRTAGFFKVRGVNLNHQEFEDFLFENRRVNDFKAELVTGEDGLDLLRLSIELRRGADADETARDVARATKATFEVTPRVEILATGALAAEFEASVKAPRFLDRRNET